jgi:hypothetical protein
MFLSSRWSRLQGNAASVPRRAAARGAHNIVEFRQDRATSPVCRARRLSTPVSILSIRDRRCAKNGSSAPRAFKAEPRRAFDGAMILRREMPIAVSFGR